MMQIGMPTYIKRLGMVSSIFNSYSRTHLCCTNRYLVGHPKIKSKFAKLTSSPSNLRRRKHFVLRIGLHLPLDVSQETVARWRDSIFSSAKNKSTTLASANASRSRPQ